MLLFVLMTILVTMPQRNAKLNARMQLALTLENMQILNSEYVWLYAQLHLLVPLAKMIHILVSRRDIVRTRGGLKPR